MCRKPIPHHPGSATGLDIGGSWVNIVHTGPISVPLHCVPYSLLRGKHPKTYFDLFEDEGQSFQDAGLCPSAMILVRECEEEE